MDYSIDFLKTEWPGAGFDLGFGCVFPSQKVVSESVKLYFDLVESEYAVERICSTDGTQLSCDSSTHATNLDSFLFDKSMETDGIILNIDLSVIHNSELYIRIDFSGSLDIGQQVENYFTGTKSKDAEIVFQLVKLVELAAEAFGPGYCNFGIETVGLSESIESKNNKELPNLTEKTDFGQLARKIGDQLEELRNSEHE